MAINTGPPASAAHRATRSSADSAREQTEASMTRTPSGDAIAHATPTLASLVAQSIPTISTRSQPLHW
jgi:hypothetical protein